MRDFADTERFRHDERAHRASAGLWWIAPILVAAAYPFASQLLSGLLILVHGSASPDTGPLCFAVSGSLLLALGVMGTAFAFERRQADLRSRAAAHLAFATPSLFVGFGNAANLFHSPQLATIAWLLFW